MKLPRFQHVDPSTSRARVTPVLRQYAPQRKAMQKSTVLPNDVNQILRNGLAEAQLIGQVFDAGIKIATQVHQTKVETESKLAQQRYLRAMAGYVASVEYAPLSDGTGSPAWLTAADDYEEYSRQVREQVADQVITTDAGRRAFEASVTNYDISNREKLAKITRGKMVNLAEADVYQTVTETMDVGEVTAALESAVASGLLNPTKAVKWEDENIERIHYQTAVVSMDHLRSRMSGLSDSEFTQAVAARREQIESGFEGISPAKRSALFNTLAGIEDDYFDRVKKERSTRMFGDMMRLYADPLSRDTFVERMHDPRMRDALGDYYDDLVRLEVDLAEGGRTDFDTARSLEKLLIDYGRGKVESADAMYLNVLHAAADGKLSKADYATFMRKVESAEAKRADSRYGRAEDLLQAYFVGGADPEYLTGPDGQEMRTKLMVAQAQLDRWVDENPQGDPRTMVPRIINAAQPVPDMAVDADGKRTSDVFAVDVARTRDEVNAWAKLRRSEAVETDDGGLDVRVGGEPIHVEEVRLNALRQLRNIELMQRMMRELE